MFSDPRVKVEFIFYDENDSVVKRTEEKLIHVPTDVVTYHDVNYKVFETRYQIGAFGGEGHYIVKSKIMQQ